MPDDMSLERQDVFPPCELSDHDKAFMIVNYPPTQVNPSAPQWTLSYALDVMGVSAYDKHAMLVARPDDVRKLFAVWSVQRLLGIPQHGIEPEDIEEPARGVEDGGQAEDDGEPNWCTPRTHPKERQQRMTDGVARGVGLVHEELWLPGATLKYWFEQLDYASYPPEPRCQDAVQVVEDAFAEWSRWSTLQFVRADDINDSHIRIWFHDTVNPRYAPYSTFSNSWTLPGYIARDHEEKVVWENGIERGEGGGTARTTMYLYLPEPPSSDPPIARRRALHEIGHALGLMHEHGSPNSRTIVRDTENEDLFGVWTAWDPKSIMLYSERKLSTPPGAPAEYTARNTTLSNTDKNLISVRFSVISHCMVCPHALLQALYCRNPGRLKTALPFLNLQKPAQDELLQIAASYADPNVDVAETAARFRARLGRLLWEQNGPAGYGPPGSGVARGINEDGGAVTDPDGDFNNWHWCATEAVNQQLVESGGQELTRGDGIARGVAHAEEYIWPVGCTISFWIGQADYRREPPEAAVAQRVEALLYAFAQWSQYSSVQFVRAPNIDAANIRIWFHDTTKPTYAQFSTHEGSWSWIGKKSRNARNPLITVDGVRRPAKGGTARTAIYLSLPAAPFTDETWPVARRRALHEVGHCLGLDHEQASPLTRTRQRETKYEERLSFWTAWDPQSVMLYPNLLLQGNQVPPRTAYNTELSQTDKDLITVRLKNPASLPLINPLSRHCTTPTYKL